MSAIWYSKHSAVSGSWVGMACKSIPYAIDVPTIARNRGSLLPGHLLLTATYWNTDQCIVTMSETIPLRNSSLIDALDNGLDSKLKYPKRVILVPSNSIRHAKTEVKSMKTQFHFLLVFNPHFNVCPMSRWLQSQIHTISITRGDGEATEFFALAEVCTTTSDVVCLTTGAISLMP